MSPKPALWESNGVRSNWDGLRRDQDLCQPMGDCAIYLYEQGQSKRGASFQIPYQILVDRKCGPLLDLAIPSSGSPPSTPSHSRSSSDQSDRSSLHETNGSEAYRIYLGAPKHFTKDQAYSWHLTSRNFFAWVLQKPLVGLYLSRALIDLLGRMSMYRDGFLDNVADLLEYADSIGYSEFSNRPELALARLSFADEFKLQETWIDAFAHCVGMHESLGDCREFEVTRNVNKALIQRAALQMEIRLEKLAKSVNSFLEEELAETEARLSPGANRHMHQFRSFLRSHLRTTYGTWPPANEQYSKPLYDELLQEFDCLYSYLADMEADETNPEISVSSEISLNGLLHSFNVSNSLEPLPYTHTLLPEVNEGAGYRTQAHWALRRNTGSKEKLSPVELVTAANATATNRDDPLLLESRLVREYERFETSLAKSFDDQLSFTDARKVRWILIYAMTSHLLYAHKPAPQVQDAESASYPLCCSVAGVPAWSLNTPSKRESTASSIYSAQGSSRSSRSDDGSSQTSNEGSGRSSVSDEDFFTQNYVFTNGSTAHSATSQNPLIPSKSVRRSLYGPSSPDLSRTQSEPRASSSHNYSDFSIKPLQIPDRTSSRSGKPHLHRSNTEPVARPNSAESDTVPSLDWSSVNSPSMTDDSASDNQDSITDDSSSTYSLRPEVTTPEKDPKPFSAVEKSFEPVFWDYDGDFICPGIST